MEIDAVLLRHLLSMPLIKMKKHNAAHGGVHCSCTGTCQRKKKNKKSKTHPQSSRGQKPKE